jgi:hypothetical protein
MSRFRFLLLGLMMLALPMQGFAAAGMLFCGPGHHDASSQAVPAMAHSHEDGAKAISDGHPAHAHPASTEKPQPGKLSIDKVGADTCSVCSACCNAVALPVAAAIAPAITPHAGPAQAVSAFFTGFIAASLERPPRLLLG